MAVNKSSLPSSYRGATNIISTDGNESDSQWEIKLSNNRLKLNGKHNNL